MQREGKSLLFTVPLPTAAPHHRPSQPSALPPGLSTTAAVSQPPLSLSLPLPQTPSLAHSSPWLSTMAQPRAARKQSSERLRTTPNSLPGPCQCHQQSGGNSRGNAAPKLAGNSTSLTTVIGDQERSGKPGHRRIGQNPCSNYTVYTS